MTINKTKGTRGGKREGSGRKSYLDLGIANELKVHLNIYIERKYIDKFGSKAEAEREAKEYLINKNTDI